MILVWLMGAGVCAWCVYSGLVSGVAFLPRGGRKATRGEDPVPYWITIISYAGAVVFMLYQAADLWRAATKP